MVLHNATDIQVIVPTRKRYFFLTFSQEVGYNYLWNVLETDILSAIFLALPI